MILIILRQYSIYSISSISYILYILYILYIIYPLYSISYHIISPISPISYPSSSTLQYAGDLAQSVASFESTVESALQTCAAQIDQNRAQVLELLLKGVGNCEPRIHPNAALKLQQAKAKKESGAGK